MSVIIVHRYYKINRGQEYKTTLLQEGQNANYNRITINHLNTNTILTIKPRLCRNLLKCCITNY